ncbi:MAG TPA: tetraacyldisaccharide 4'-kinase [Gammaproteobacteria bacterium]|nr:tetraacyldisaccharide 4'-kinase [Gammaproteobacteria bacterium]
MKFDLTKHWYRNDLVSFALWPVSLLLCGLAKLRRKRIEKQGHLLSQNVPVIIVGNITVGGTGKTPMVIWLARFLRQQGFKPGIVSRGYGGNHQRATLVTNDSNSLEVGDEALVIARRSGVPLCVGKDRLGAANTLLASKMIDVIISDDGMQHYRLPRAIEIAMLDGERRFGNGLCLPAGPLREPESRLSEVDFQIVTGTASSEHEISMQLKTGRLFNLNSPAKTKALESLRGHQVHAIAGIGNPDRFFNLLEDFGLIVERHPFPDHYRYETSDLHFNDGKPVLMTEKDAVKCGLFAESHFWYLPIEARLPESLGEQILNRLEEWRNGQ